MAKTTAAEIEALAGAMWIMAAAVAFTDGKWGNKELNAFAEVIGAMHDYSKSPVVKAVALFHAKDERAEAVVNRDIRHWKSDLADAASVLESLSVADAIRFVFWHQHLGTEIAIAQNKGRFLRSSKISQSQMKTISNCLLPLLIGPKVLKQIANGPELNPLLNITKWVEVNGK